MLHRSSIINKIVSNIMIIKVMYKAKLPHIFVDSRPRGVIARIHSLAGYRPLSRRLDRCDRMIQNEGNDSRKLFTLKIALCR